MHPFSYFLWLARRFTLRRMITHWPRLLLLLPGIALSVAVTVAIVYARGASIEAFGSAVQFLKGSNIPELRSVLGEIDQESLTEWVPHLKGVSAVPVLEVPGVVGDHGVTLFGVDLIELSQSDAHQEFQIAHPREAGAGISVVLSARAADNLSVKPGDRITMTARQRAFDLLVGSVIDDPNEQGQGFILASLPEIQSVIGAPGIVSSVWLLPHRSGASIANEWLESEHATEMARSLSPDYFITSSNGRKREAENLLSAFQMNVSVMVIVTIFVCALTVFNSAQLSMLTVSQEISILRTMGASRGLCFGVLLAESLVVGLVGSIVGLTLGLPLVKLVARLFLRTVNGVYLGRPGEVAGVAIDQWWLFAIGGALGVSMSILGAFYPALKASAAPPSISIRSSIDSVRLRSGLLFLCGLGALGISWVLVIVARSTGVAWCAHLGSAGVLCAIALVAPRALEMVTGVVRGALEYCGRVAGLISVSHLLGSPGVSAISVATTGIGIAVLTGLGVMVTSFRETLTTWVTYTIRADVFVRGMGEEGAGAHSIGLADQEILRTHPGVSEVYRYASIQSPLGGREVTVAGVDLDVGVGREVYRILDGTLDLPRLMEGRDVLISESVSRRTGMHVGQVVQFGGRGFQVQGVFKDFTAEQGLVLVHFPVFKDMYRVENIFSASLYLADPTQAPQIREELSTKLVPGRTTVTLNRELREIIFKIFDQTFEITALLRAIVVLICAGGFVVAVFQLLWERRTEIWVLQKLGMNGWQLHTAVLLEGLVTSAVGALLGLAGGVVLAFVLIDVVNPLSFGWTLDTVYRWTDFLIPVLLVLVANLLATAFPVRSVRRS